MQGCWSGRGSSSRRSTLDSASSRVTWAAILAWVRGGGSGVPSGRREFPAGSSHSGGPGMRQETPGLRPFLPGRGLSRFGPFLPALLPPGSAPRPPPPAGRDARAAAPLPRRRGSRDGGAPRPCGLGPHDAARGRGRPLPVPGSAGSGGAWDEPRKRPVGSLRGRTPEPSGRRRRVPGSLGRQVLAARAQRGESDSDGSLQ